MRMPMKKMLAALCAMAMVITAFPTIARAETSGQFSYKTYDGKFVEITGYTGKDSVVEIPETIAGLPVTTIGAAAFRNNTNITMVKMYQITTIKDSAFSGCTKLTEVIPFRLITIGDSAFDGCTGLKTMMFPNGLTSIGLDAFLNCYLLNKVDIPASVTTLGSHCLGFVGAGSNYIPNAGFTMNVTKDSSALNYAIENKLKYTIDGTEPPKTTSIADATVTAIPDQRYTGSEIKPEVTVTYKTTTLKKDTDYTVSYANNINVGTATVTITGIGNYSGTKTATFNITSNAFSVTAADHYFSYTDNARKFKINAKASVNNATFTYQCDNNNLEITTKGAVTLAEGFEGSATITVIAKAEGYESTTTNVKVYVPKSVSMANMERLGNTTADVMWELGSEVTGYVLQYSTSSKFTIDPSEITTTKNRAKLKDLTKGQSYYVRVRTYYEKNGKTYYSKYSKAEQLSGTPSDARLYANYLKNQAKKVDKILAYTSADLDGDGVQELLYQYYNGGNRNAAAICTIKDGVVKRILNRKNGSPSFFISDNTQLMLNSSNNSTETFYYIYVMKDGAMKKLHTYKVAVNQRGKKEYYCDGKKIKYSEFKTVKKQFKKMETQAYS